MNARLECEQLLLVQAEFDGELDAADAVAASTHRRSCSSCEAAYAAMQRGSTLVRSVPKFKAPDALRSRLAAQLAEQNTASVTPIRKRWKPGPWLGGAFIGALAASLAMVMIQTPQTATQQLYVDSHVRALQSPEHLLDVISTEHHVVKPWFAGRLDFSPPVKDLATIGYPLEGARIDVIDGRDVAVLVYKAGRHTIDLFIAPQMRGDREKASAERGFNIREWTAGGMTMSVVSDLNSHELDAFVSHWQTGS